VPARLAYDRMSGRYFEDPSDIPQREYFQYKNNQGEVFDAEYEAGPWNAGDVSLEQFEDDENGDLDWEVDFTERPGPLDPHGRYEQAHEEAEKRAEQYSQ